MTTQTVHVAVAVIYNQQKQVLIAKRASHQHQGNKWEFPGGKVESNESSQQALVREIQEEIGILVESSELIVEITHHYGNEQDNKKNAKKVCLDVYRVKSWSGKESGREGQQIKWVEINKLNNYQFPKANDEIILLIQTVS